MKQIKANNKPNVDKKSETEVKKIKNGGHVALKNYVFIRASFV